MAVDWQDTNVILENCAATFFFGCFSECVAIESEESCSVFAVVCLVLSMGQGKISRPFFN